MAVEQTEVKTILLTGPITLYEVSAVRETCAWLGRREAASDRFERFGTLGHGRPPASDLLRRRAGRDRDLEVRLVEVPDGLCPGLPSDPACRNGSSRFAR